MTYLLVSRNLSNILRVVRGQDELDEDFLDPAEFLLICTLARELGWMVRPSNEGVSAPRGALACSALPPGRVKVLKAPR